MAQELTLRTNQQPSFLNKEMAIGMLIGALVPGGHIAIPLLAVATGAAVGGFIGEKRMEREQREGKKVGEPSMWNKDTLLGGLIGAVGGQILAAMTVVAVALSGGTLGGALLAGGAVAIGATAIGSYLGGKSGETRMKAEYAQAQNQNVMQNVGMAMSPEIAHAMEAGQKQYAQQVEQERLLAAQQQTQR